MLEQWSSRFWGSALRPSTLRGRWKCTRTSADGRARVCITSTIDTFENAEPLLRSKTWARGDAARNSSSSVDAGAPWARNGQSILCFPHGASPRAHVVPERSNCPVPRPVRPQAHQRINPPSVEKSRARPRRQDATSTTPPARHAQSGPCARLRRARAPPPFVMPATRLVESLRGRSECGASPVPWPWGNMEERMGERSGYFDAHEQVGKL